MTPQEKAKQLVDKFKLHSYYDAHDLTPRFRREESNIESAVECALIAVDEIIHALSYKQISNIEEIEYYEEVKQEIGKL